MGLENKIKILDYVGFDVGNFEEYLAMIGGINIQFSIFFKNIDKPFINVNVEHIKTVIEYLGMMGYNSEKLEFNMNVFQYCGAYTIDIHLEENGCKMLKNVILEYQQKDMDKIFNECNRIYNKIKNKLTTIDVSMICKSMNEEYWDCEEPKLITDFKEFNELILEMVKDDKYKTLGYSFWNMMLCIDKNINYEYLNENVLWFFRDGSNGEAWLYTMEQFKNYIWECICWHYENDDVELKEIYKTLKEIENK